MLGVQFSPSRDALMFARRRGVLVANTCRRGGHSSAGTSGRSSSGIHALFRHRPGAIFRETRRLLADGGDLVIGFLLAGFVGRPVRCVRRGQATRGARYTRPNSNNCSQTQKLRPPLHAAPTAGLARYDISRP